MGKNNIERNKLDYLLTDIMPVEISELFSYREFYDFLTEEKEELKIIKDELLKIKSKGKEKLFNGGWWASTPLKYNILKGVSGTRELNLVQPISALNIFLFIECYQKEILGFLENNHYYSLRYHRKNSNLYYKRKTNRVTEYFYKTSRKVNKGILQQTGAFFKIHKFNSVTDFTNSRLWQMCNFKYKCFAKVDYKSCFNSIYSHVYKWIIERNTVDSKDANNNNLFIIIDRILQNINGKSSNGVIVGPEFSRMISEILLQQIDKEVFYYLQSQGLFSIRDYRIFRYVDDIFIFANSQITINTIIESIEAVSRKYLLQLNELKQFTANTPVILKNWIEKTRQLSDKISDLFYKSKEIHDLDDVNYVVKKGFISIDRLKNEFAILMKEYPEDRRYIVSYILSTLLNKISMKKDGFQLFENGKEKKAFVLLELAFYVYSFCPCFDHTQRIISMIVYMNDELRFKSAEDDNHHKLQNLIRRYSFLMESANLNDICNLFVFFYEYKITLLQQSENTIFEKIKKENNPILWANYLIYSKYNSMYFKDILQQLELKIDISISEMIPYEPLLQYEFWYILVFFNCPYLSSGLKSKINGKIAEINNNISGANAVDKVNKLIIKFLNRNQRNSFFLWGYYQFDTSKQMTYRTYQRTLFRQYKNKRTVELYGSLDS